MKKVLYSALLLCFLVSLSYSVEKTASYEIQPDPRTVVTTN